MLDKFFRSILLVIFFFIPWGCGAPQFDIDSEEGRAAIMDAVNNALTRGDCATAIRLIEPLYESQYTSNNVRLLRASAHGCNAGIDYLSVLTSLASETLTNGGVWTVAAKYFPYIDLSGLDSGWQASDALMASIEGSKYVPNDYRFNTSTYNYGSLDYTTRTSSSNNYLFFVSLSIMGRSQTRWGAPDSNHEKTQDLPWITSAAMTKEGVAYAGAVVNFIDSFDAVIGSATSSIKDSLSTIKTAHKAAVGAACLNGCTNTALTGCTLTATECLESGGNFCPMELRYRENFSISGVASTENPAVCAAAGVVNMINTDAIFKWPN